ncbi:DUF4811 domain-containing protein [Apilactobacillus apisilvae]|uniref:DUF4811 domain-containing protein n=1 Tax=Apilactobacillus apisilvae TaxID=2923364 RepID=A0ABY4PGW2_9LACO|nr:DUF4811 domain-containing protein [Apilactobacillus apisilvae]UQS84974.1 DUF4811 domain-containing protein [Apilactobacillus apisilvae]
MILIILVISALCFFLFNNLLVKNKALHWTTTIISFVALIISVTFITLNFHDHYGMHKVTDTNETKLVSSNSKMNMLLNQPIGTSGKDKVVIYRTNNNQTKPKTTSTDKNTNYIITDANSAKLVTKTTRYEYKSKTAKFWFDLAQKPTRVKTVNYFYVPKDWLNLTVSQAKALPNIMKKLQSSIQSSGSQAQMKSAAQSYVQGKMMQAMQKNPKMSKESQTKLQKQLVKEFTNQQQAQVMQKMMPQIKQELSKVK